MNLYLNDLTSLCPNSKLDIFNSRSEAVAAIVEKTLLSQLDNFELLKEQISKLEEIQDTARDIAYDVLRGK